MSINDYIRYNGVVYQRVRADAPSQMEERLKSLKTLWRQPDTMALWGIPYGMRSGQSPRDLYDAGNTKGWLWLGSPGWWGNMSELDREAVKKFLDDREEAIPLGPGEWSTLHLW